MAAPRVSFGDKDLENGRPDSAERNRSRKWSTAPGPIEELDEYTALQKYISTYRDPKAAAADDAEGQAKDAADAKKGKAWWQFWRSGSSANAKQGADPGTVPEEWLEADIKQGISSHDVETRRKRFGWNEITTEKENLFIKFLMFFTGPILYGKLLISAPLLPMARQACPGRLHHALALALAAAAARSRAAPHRKALPVLASRVRAAWAGVRAKPRFAASRKQAKTTLTVHVQSWKSPSFLQPVCVIGSISELLLVF